jgi:hypothetical protein
MDLKVIGWDGLTEFVAQNRDKLCAAVNTVMNLLFP